MQSAPTKLKVVDKKFTDYSIHWLIISIKFIFVILALCWNLTVRKIICPLVPFLQVNRYIKSVVNLLSMKFILIMLGFFRFQCEGFRFFSRESSKIILRSGFIGIGTHYSIIDYIYYSYLTNPVFVKILIYKKADKTQTYYCPLSFIQSIKCALYYRGYDPIIIHSQKEFKNIKYRKLSMKTLISECFQELNGPIFIMLPGLNPKQHISLDKLVANDIYENQIKFERSLVGFCVKVDPRLKLEEYTYRNQLFLMLDQMSRIGNFNIYINAIQFRKFKNRYDRVTYSSFVDRYYKDHQLLLRQIDYSAYLEQMNEVQAEAAQIAEESQKSKQI